MTNPQLKDQLLMWDDIEWSARKLCDAGFSLVPLDGKGKPLTDWRASLASNVSRLPIEEMAEWFDNGQAKGLAIALGSSLNGDLFCRTFEDYNDYLASIRLMGEQALPLACCFREESGEKDLYHVLFLLDEKQSWMLEEYEETSPGKYIIESARGLIRCRENLIRIPPTEGVTWIQEPRIDSNLYYYGLMETGLTPAPF